MSQNTGTSCVKREWQLTKSLPKILWCMTGLITLVAVYFTYYLEYKKDVFLALTFLQEKLTNTPVSIAPKTHYNNLFRSVTLFEQKVTPTESSAEI